MRGEWRKAFAILPRIGVDNRIVWGLALCRVVEVPHHEIPPGGVFSVETGTVQEKEWRRRCFM